MTTATLLCPGASPRQHRLARCPAVHLSAHSGRHHSQDVNALLDVAALLLGSGTSARRKLCLQQAIRLAPQDYRAHVNLANWYREIVRTSRLAPAVSAIGACAARSPADPPQCPGQPGIRPDASPAVRRTMAQLWVNGLQARVGGRQPRPPAPALNGRLRVGYVSADFCQHTVGLLLVAGRLARTQPGAGERVAYSAGGVSDWVSRNIAACSQWRDVAALDDAALAAQVRADGIDVLVDLSWPHRRLAADRLCPAPGPGASLLAGLLCHHRPERHRRALLLDDWHAPPEVAARCIEPDVAAAARQVLLPARAVGADHGGPATLSDPGHITFGCFAQNSTRPSWRCGRACCTPSPPACC